jgi:hypothetical protein
MKFARKLYLGSSSLILSAVLVIGVAKVRADSDDGNYLLTGLRIVSRCNPAVPLPGIPAPLTTTTTNTCAAPATQPPTPPLNRDNSWSFDISFFDPVFQKYYLADRDNFGIDIVDTRTNTAVGLVTGFVGTISAPANSAGPNGVLTTHNPNQLWGGDGNGDVRIYNLDNSGLSTGLLKVISHTVTKTAKRADEMGYDPDHQIVLVAWDDDSDLLLALISVTGNPTVLGTINLNPSNPTQAANSCTKAGFPGGCSTGGIEQPQYDPRIRRFLLAVPSSSGHPNGEVLVINPVTQAVEKAWDTTTNVPKANTACIPQGLTIGPGHQVLLGCNGGTTVGNPQVTLIIDDRGSGPNGSNINIIKTITQVGGSDEVWFNPGDNNYYTASSSHTSTNLVGGPADPVVGIIEAGWGGEGPEWIQNVTTGAGSHSVAAAFEVRCDRDDRGFGDDQQRGDRGRGDDQHRDCDHAHYSNNRALVPVRTNQAGNNEPGGIGIVKQD